MIGLTTRRLKTDPDLLKFQEKVFQELEVRFPLDYLNRSIVRVFEEKGEFVGGYMVVYKGPFRALAGIPDFELPEKYKEDEIIEYTGLWFKPNSKNILHSCFLWINMLKDGKSLSGKKYLVYTYDLNKAKLQDMYMTRLSPRVLYQGRVKMLEGMVEESYESVEIIKTNQITFIAIKLIVKAMFSKLPI